MTLQNILYSDRQAVRENHIEGYLYGAELEGGGRMYWDGENRQPEYNTIMLICRGSMTYSVNKKAFTIEGPGIHGIPRWTEIGEINYSEDFHGCMIGACNDLLLDIFRNNNPLPLESLYDLSWRHGIMQLSADECETLYSDIQNIITTLGKKSHHFCNEKNYAYLYIFTADIADLIWKRYGNGVPGHNLETSRSDIIFQHFLELIEENIEHAHTTGFYAEKLCISKQYLSMVVKEKTGSTIGKVISKMRAEKALRLLIHTNLSIKQIADRLSFPDQSTFGKFFKKQFGNPPLSYRNSIAKNLRFNSDESTSRPISG